MVGLHRRPARSLLGLLVADPPPGTDNHRLDPQIDGLMLFTFVVGLAVSLWYVWLVIHRFRVAYLEEQLDEQLFHQALADGEPRPTAAGRPGRPAPVGT